MENSLIHVENSLVHVENSPDIFEDPFGLEKLSLELEKKAPMAGWKREERIAFWGNTLFDFATGSACGRSGGKWLATDSDLLFMLVYSPQDMPHKRNLWAYMTGIINCCHDEVVVMGDFNEVRFDSERHGSTFYASNAAKFNTFITNSHLIDVPLVFKRRVSRSMIVKWIDNPDRVKREFYNHFANRFSAPNWSRVSMEGIFPRRFGADSSHDLEGDISNDDIKRRFRIWAIDRGMFAPILAGKNNLVPISHLFVHCSLYVLDVHSSDIQIMANSFGCLANNLLFTYLGMKVAANVVRINSWNKVIQKVTINLSKWKAKSLSVGGAEMDEHKMTWVYGSASSKLFTFLMVLLINHPRHVPIVLFGSRFIKQSLVLNLRPWIFWGFAKSDWLFNLDLQKDASVAQKFHNPDFAVSFRRRPRGGIEESQFQELSSLLYSVALSSSSDRWSWTLNGHGDFSVKSAREEIDKHLLITSSSSTRWSKLLPIKLNVFAWRMLLDKLPTRINLSNRGLDVPCVLCPNCGNAVESRNHLFFGYLMALDLFRLLASKSLPRKPHSYPCGGIYGSTGMQFCFPSISPIVVSGWSGTLVGQGSVTIVFTNADYLPSSLSFPHSYLFEDSLRLSRLGLIFLFSTMGYIDSLKSVLTQSALDDLCEKYYIPDAVHPELPGPNSRIRRSPTDKIGVYTRFLDYANYRIPLSQFLVDILEYFQIHLSQLSVIAAAKVSHFEILCRVHSFIPTMGNFRRFYVNSHSKGWISFSKRSDHAAVCYTKPLDSLKDWNDRFFWVDASIFPLTVPWHSAKSLRKDTPPALDEFSAEVCDFLMDNPAPFKKFPEAFLEGEVPLLELTKDRVVPLAGVYDQGDVAALGVGGIKILADDEAQALIADKPKKLKKRKTDDGAGGFGLPPKKLSVDHGTSGDASASTARNSLAVLQNLLDKITLAAKVGATTAATIPLVTSSVAPIPEHEGGEYADSVSAANVQTRRPTERFIISSDTHDSNANVADDKVSSVVRDVNEATHASIFTDSTYAGNVDPNAAGPSQPSGNDISSESFYVSLDMDSEALRQAYVPRWDVLNDSLLGDSNFNVVAARQTCLSAEVRMRLKHILRGKKRLEDRCGMQEKLVKERDLEIANLKARLSLKVAEEAARACELGSLKEQSVALKSAAAAKDAKIAKLSQDLSQLHLCLRWRLHVLSFVEKCLVMKCLHSSEYMTALGGDIGHAIEKGIQAGLAAGIDHGQTGRVLADVAAYDPSAEANYLASINDLHSVDFSLLAQLESRKDASIIDIMDLLHFEGSDAKTPEGLLLHPSPEQLMVPIHRLEDQVVIGEISLSDSLEVAHNGVQRLKGDATIFRLSLTDVMVPLVEPLSVRSLAGEVSTSEVLAVTTAVTTKRGNRMSHQNTL
ncbi:gypsy type transposase [Tanacetum coccineum]|uniref:Gypsy type transposase n=1 Tax=Tanacetum coccineum TaxID=301880 RepID=A0ABQ5CV27_9ASTR